jgi:hypothetical protein
MEKHIEIAIDEQASARGVALRRIEDRLAQIDAQLLSVEQRSETLASGSSGSSSSSSAVLEQRIQLLQQSLQARIEKVEAQYVNLDAESASARAALKRDVGGIRSALDACEARSVMSMRGAASSESASLSGSLLSRQHQHASVSASGGGGGGRGTVAERRQRLHELYRELSSLEQQEAERFLTAP